MKTLKFSRSLENRKKGPLQKLYRKMLMARALGSVVVTTPGAIKSMLLFYLDLLLNVREKGTNEPLLLVPRGLLDKELRKDLARTWCSSAKRENFSFSRFYHVTQITRISLVSLTHTARKSLENQRSNAHIIMMNT